MEGEEDANRSSVCFWLGVTFNADLAAVPFDKILRNE
jgi:hypothetical protein